MISPLAMPGKPAVLLFFGAITHQVMRHDALDAVAEARDARALHFLVGNGIEAEIATAATVLGWRRAQDADLARLTPGCGFRMALFDPAFAVRQELGFDELADVVAKRS